MDRRRRRLELRACSRRRTGSCNVAAGRHRHDPTTLTSLHALQRQQRDCPADLCDLPELSEASLIDSLRRRFDAGAIYTYVGAILVAVNPFRYYPIYNPKYVTMYQGCRGRRDLAPHIFAVADAAYAALSQRRCDQCVVISGESGSGKTQTANLVLNHLSALSRRIFYSDSKIEESILSAGPVLEVIIFSNSNGSDVSYHYKGIPHSSFHCYASLLAVLCEFTCRKLVFCCTGLHVLQCNTISCLIVILLRTKRPEQKCFPTNVLVIS